MLLTLTWLAAALAAEPVRVRVNGGASVYAAAADVVIATAPLRAPHLRDGRLCGLAELGPGWEAQLCASSLDILLPAP